MEAIKWLAALIAATLVLFCLVGIGAFILTVALTVGVIVGCGLIVLGIAKLIRSAFS